MGQHMIDYEVIDGIAYIRLNRPEKLNAFTNSGLVEYVAALDRLDRDDDAQIGIVSGAGRAFSSGSDIDQRLLAIADGGVDSRTLPSETQAVLRCENYKPLVAAVHGYAIGHALGTALLCELVVAAQDTRFQVTETLYGVPTASFWAHIAGSTGAAFANDVVLTGRFFSASEAFGAGLITKVTAAGQHLEEATALARQVMAHPQAALRETVRYRRAVLAERLQHAAIVAGSFKWNMTDGFKDAIRARASR
jgi:enoyl-CoA hydratase/carnithine racemase